jgi:hypothetical protein
MTVTEAHCSLFSNGSNDIQHNDAEHEHNNGTTQFKKCKQLFG